MHSFYLVRHTGRPNNTDTITECYVLADRADLERVLSGLDADPRWTESSRLEVYSSGALTTTLDLLATVPTGDFDGDYRTLDLSRIDFPPLAGPVLPAGHPVIVGGEALQYGCTAFYN